MSPEKMTQAWNPDKEPGEAVSRGGRTERGGEVLKPLLQIASTVQSLASESTLDWIASSQTHAHFHLCSPDLAKVTWKCEACPLDGEKILS